MGQNKQRKPRVKSEKDKKEIYGVTVGMTPYKPVPKFKGVCSACEELGH